MRFKPYWLRLHRWITLVFALPLIAIMLSGLVLSFEPLGQKAPLPQPLTRDVLLGLLDRHDAERKATGLIVRAYDGTLTINGAGPEGAVDIDLRTGLDIEDERTGWADLFGFARAVHEKLLLDAGWLVTASTVAMLVIAGLGVLMGWPRLRNTLGGWHSVAAWAILPLVILSPLTGLAIAFGVTFTPPSSGPRPERIAIRDAVIMLGERHDLSDLQSLRARGGRLIARMHMDGGLRSVAVGKDAVQPLAMNWPRALHEGNWHAIIGSTLNIVVSIVFIGLWVTGLLIWARRKLKPRRSRAKAVLQAAE